MSNTVRIPAKACPNCHKKLDAATNPIGKASPKPNDITICLYCGHLMAFDGDLQYRDLTSSEMHRVAGDPRVLAFQRARQKAEKAMKTRDKK